MTAENSYFQTDTSQNGFSSTEKSNSTIRFLILLPKDSLPNKTRPYKTLVWLFAQLASQHQQQQTTKNSNLLCLLVVVVLRDFPSTTSDKNKSNSQTTEKLN
ncbi:MAG: hypothetical protein ACFCUE_11590 [Candidatus Bathyarchaeia archaeon]